MKYYFILGNHPSLSVAEITTVLNKAVNFDWLQKNVLIVESKDKIKAQELITQLGGTIKIGQIEKLVTKPSLRNITRKSIDLLGPGEGKFKFGISYYGKIKFNTKALAMNIKKHLREQNVNSRWVTSKEPTLSSVVVEQNKLTKQGIEIVLMEPEGEEPAPRLQAPRLFIGQTLAVQPFKELSFRDYGRPARDDRSGMLPPKLAQIMINLSRAKPSDTVLDPFCGSGTVLTEAALMGYQNLIGSDNSSKAIKDTEANMKWTIRNYNLEIRNYQLHKFDSAQLTNVLKSKSIDAIVTEPYLGPQRGQYNIQKTIKELERLYSKSLTEFRKVLKLEGRVVMIWPTFAPTVAKASSFAKASADRSVGRKATVGKPIFINPEINSFKIINPIPESLRHNKYIKLTDRNTIIYGRPGQKIWREIVILQ